MDSLKEAFISDLKYQIEIVKGYFNESREASLTLTKLEEAIMWAEKATVKERN